MNAHSRGHLTVFVWAVVLSWLLSACMTAGGDRGDSFSSSPVATVGNGQNTPPSNRPTDDTDKSQASGASEGPGGSGPGGVRSQPQGPGPGQQPLPVPGQPTTRTKAPEAPGQLPAPPPGPPAPNQPSAPETVVLEWLPIGPVGRGDPVWYVDLKDLDCQSLDGYSEPFDTMQAAAKTLCLGLKGDQVAWQKVVSALDTMPPPPSDDCWSVTAYHVLGNVAASRKQKPNALVKLAPRPGTACAPELKGLEDDGGISPPSLVCPGSVIVLLGNVTGLPVGTVRSVKVGTTTAPVRQRQSSTNNDYPLEFYFLAPPLSAGDPTTADVSIADADWVVKGSASFEYAADQNECRQTPGVIP